MIPWLLNSAWQLACKASADQFQAAIEHPAQVQRNILRQMLSQNQATEFGRRYGFATISGPQEYADRVPLQTYDSLSGLIAAIAKGKESVLTQQRVTRLLPSSGSCAARKLIPYTRDYQQQLNRAISPWLYNLMLNRPGIKNGRAFWSLSPKFDVAESDSSGVPIGFDDDSAYLSLCSRILARQLFAVPSSLQQISDIDAFRYQQVLYLLACEDLSLISIWHPSYLSLLLNDVAEQWTQLLHDLAKISKNKRRIAYLQRQGCESYEKLWPNLKLISCWGSAHAAGAFRELKHLFPTTEFQQKGLLASEAVVSIPYFESSRNQASKVLAINSHFLEFLQDDGKLKLAHELTEGEHYRVVVTTGSGLYRYQMQDRIVVTGKLRQTPTLEFIGKEDSISDYYGEKLSDGFVASKLAQVLEQQHIDATFIMLAPDQRGKSLGYTLYLEASESISQQLAAKLDDRLSENPHYRLCRQLGQLAPLSVFRISGSAHKAFIQRRMQQGCRFGDIKPVSLSKQTGWSDFFDGCYLW